MILAHPLEAQSETAHKISLFYEPDFKQFLDAPLIFDGDHWLSIKLQNEGLRKKALLEYERYKKQIKAAYPLLPFEKQKYVLSDSSIQRIPFDLREQVRSMSYYLSNCDRDVMYKALFCELVEHFFKNVEVENEFFKSIKKMTELEGVKIHQVVDDFFTDSDNETASLYKPIWDTIIQPYFNLWYANFQDYYTHQVERQKRIKQAKTISSKGVGFFKQKNGDQALALFKQALILSIQSFDLSDANLAVAYYNYGSALLNLSRREEALGYLKTAYNIHQKAENADGVSKVRKKIEDNYPDEQWYQVLTIHNRL